MEANLKDNKTHTRDLFDEILFKHLERLIGTRYGVGELTMDSVSISLIMLLMERESEIESFPSDKIERYNNETLTTDFEELGFDVGHQVNAVIEALIQKGYILIDNQRFIPQKSAMSMARLIDLVFPKMPGMNLVAYFVQTLDEVTSKRKDLESATRQFDQTLQMHGIPPNKGSQNSEPSKESTKPENKGSDALTLDKSSQTHQEKTSRSRLTTPNILGRKSSGNLFDYSKSISTEPRVLSSDGYKGKVNIRKVDFGRSDSKENEIHKKPAGDHTQNEDSKLASKEKHIETPPFEDADSESADTNLMRSSEKSNKTVDDNQGIDDNTAAAKSLDAPDTDSFDKDGLHDTKPAEQNKSLFVDVKDDSLQAEPPSSHIERTREAEERAPETSSENEDFSINDDAVEKRISDFEEDLALECPLCKHSKVTVENTATGKAYYKCSNDKCNFISWGKPYHILCPKCNNPFLIEANNNAGKTILKCPRATCRYWKKAQVDITDNPRETFESGSSKINKVASVSRKPRKRVVRRRVVRRKK